MSQQHKSEMNESSMVSSTNTKDKYSSDGVVKKIKAPPQSRFETEECSSNDELSRVCFKGSSPPAPVIEISCVSSESSVSSDSEVSISECTLRATKTADEEVEDVLCSYLQDGTCLQVNKLSVSRQGRDLQRWDKDPHTSSLTRLTTGVVPITNDGRIVFVSSAKKREWILPKGGWELDESMEQSALRETFEEAGLLGILGPRLSDITFETRKAKKRRLEGQDVPEHFEVNQNTSGKCSMCSSDDSQVSLSVGGFEQKDISTFSVPVNICKSCDTCSPARTNLPSIERKPAKYDMCRMSLHVLYITKVLDTWPECGRARKLCTIDEGIEITRPEFKEALLEVKKRGFHLHPNLN